MKTDASKCVCHMWASGKLHLNFVRDAADDHVVAVEERGPFPRRIAVSGRFVGRMNQQMPGMAEIQGGTRLIIRTTRMEHAYKRAGACPGCGYVLLESEGAG